ncbi:hypothetical protein LX97_01015 [Nonlabens dokdonensis]|jgi:hypothetical protein|uniref:Lipoprotein n=1 Tax=Nonlabens dokdonensis TaxID=328515 RepID=A0ABX5Q1S2_9FLAO|nr:hypothetical protein [Nonlabens dokdonensis]PZX44010.1 hypothetical protein LX97_01015 [Nonlabens dokdonensis]
MNKQKHLLKYFSIGILTLSLSLISCEDELTNETLTTKSEEGGGDIKCDFEPYGLYFDNGVAQVSTNNMLHFPSMDSFYQTLDDLEQQVENHEDSFVIPNSNLSEDDLNDLEESSGFNADLPLDEFEQSHEFYSLRKDVLIAEEAFLDTSDQPGFDWANDPDDVPLIDGIERTVFNPQQEVIICNMIYKYVEDGLIGVNMNNANATDILTAANNGASGEELADIYGGKEEEAGDLVFYPEITDEADCFYNLNKVKRFFQGSYKMKNKQKMKGNPGPFHYVFKAVTKNYKKKRKWKKRRIKSYARIVGKIHDIYIGCGSLEPLDKSSSHKKRRRREVSHRISRSLGANANGVPLSSIIGTELGQLESEHKQHSWIVNWTYEP